MQALLNFDKMLSAMLIRVVYWIGLLGLAIFGVVTVLGGLSTLTKGGFYLIAGMGSMLLGVVVPVIGAVLLRLGCEAGIILFVIHENLVAIQKNTERPSYPAPPTFNPPPMYSPPPALTVQEMQ